MPKIKSFRVKSNSFTIQKQSLIVCKRYNKINRKPIKEKIKKIPLIFLLTMATAHSF